MWNKENNLKKEHCQRVLARFGTPQRIDGNNDSNGSKDIILGMLVLFVYCVKTKGYIKYHETSYCYIKIKQVTDYYRQMKQNLGYKSGIPRDFLTDLWAHSINLCLSSLQHLAASTLAALSSLGSEIYNRCYHFMLL